jgi:hypothetical protein
MGLLLDARSNATVYVTPPPRIVARRRYPMQVSKQAAPSWPVEIDWTHPLTRGLTGCYIASQLKDLTGNGPAMPTDDVGPPFAFAQSGSGPAIVNGGPGSVSDGGTPPPGWLSTPPAPWLSTSVSVFAQVETSVGSTLGEASYGVIDPTHNYSQYYSVALGGYGSISFYVNNGVYNASSQLNLGWPASGISTGIPFRKTILGTSAVGGLMQIYFGGQVVASQAAPTVAPVYFNICSPAFGLGGQNQKSSMVAWFDVEKTAAEAAWLDAEPFAFLRPVVRRTYFISQ